MRYVFREIGERRTRRFKCTCGKSHQKTETFYQTLNPFNKNGDGSVKSSEQISLEVNAEANAWHRKLLDCPQVEGCHEIRAALSKARGK
jgi:hypothetical protein